MYSNTLPKMLCINVNYHYKSYRHFTFDTIHFPSSSRETTLDYFATMKSCLALVLVFGALICACIGAESEVSSNNKTPGARRSGRNYDKFYKSPKNSYGDDGSDDDDDDDDDDNYQPDSNNGQSPPGYNSFKGYGPYGYPPFGGSFKGIPYYPSFKGGFKFPGQIDSPALTPEQFVTMMNALNKPEDNKEEGGFLSKLVSDPKSLTAAALVPLSLMLASVVPVIMNYMMTGVSAPGTQLVSTTATNNKEGRGLDSYYNLDVVLDNIAEFARSMEGEECIQKAICKVASGDAQVPGSDYIKKAASAVAHFVKDDWINNVSMKDIFNGVKEGNCENICNSFKSTPRHRK